MSAERGWSRGIALGAVLLLCASEALLAQGRRPPETFTATTVGMTPAGVGLKVDVLEWSDDEARAAAIAALRAAEDGALSELPTLGYVWLDGSGVGYALKYAHRAELPDEGERVTFVTDKPLGAYSFNPWSADGPASGAEAGYSVIELYLDDAGSGVGTLSLAAEVILDESSDVVALGEGEPQVLAEALRAPPPYWAQGS